MRILPDAKHAAQYVRMSTEHQQYSTANQKAAIAVYAAARGIGIVATYEDAGKSGLTFNGRPALRQLIADVVAGQDLFDTILVYDVSRWGRFQDADESAHLEYMCRLSGVRIEYCAEPFSNDGTPFSSICKVVKRALAAEYSRELSEKVFRGKRRLIELGYRQGGSPGIGLRRCLIDASGNRKGILAPGERKSIATDRVILVPGPPEEIAVVHRIYADYLDRHMGVMAIAEALNREGVKSESGRPWSRAVVKRVLISEKYVGDSVWGRQSFKLQIARQHNAPDTWARFDGAFEGIVSRDLFEKAQKVKAARAKRITDEQVIARLRAIHRERGIITARLIRKDCILGVAAVRKRFGSLVTAYDLAGFRPTRDLAFISHNCTAQRLRASVAEAIVEGFRSRDQQIERLSGACRFLINGEIKATVTVVKQRRSQRGNPRWLVKGSLGNDDLRIAVLMDGLSERARTFYLFPAGLMGNEHLLSPRNQADIEAFRADSLEKLFDLCARREPQPRDATIATSGLTDHSPAQRVVPPLKRSWQRLLRSRRPKTYSGTFIRVSARMRVAFARADATRARVDELRGTLVRLLLNGRFVRLLASEGVGTVPRAAYRASHHSRRKAAQKFRDDLRKEALDLLSGDELSRRARALLDKLVDAWRVEAAELMVLVNDLTEYFARALVVATPPQGLLEPPRFRAFGARLRRLKALRAEREYMHREGKRSLAAYGRDALDLIVVQSFVRRLMATPAVVAWLERHDRNALQSLQ
jgi:DNA invertase Pin-like site-specific DNA recombinase